MKIFLIALFVLGLVASFYYAFSVQPVSVENIKIDQSVSAPRTISEPIQPQPTVQKVQIPLEESKLDENPSYENPERDADRNAVSKRDEEEKSLHQLQHRVP